MTRLIRPLIEGELWWSAMSRHAAMVLPLGPVKRHLALAGNRRSLGSPLFPRQLQLLSVNLNLEITGEQLVQDHSLLPYYSPFLAPRKVARATRCMLANGNVEFFVGVTPMEDYPAWLRACPRCKADDIETYGTALWHRAHQPPGVVVCTRHGCELEETTASARAISQIAPLQTAEEAGVQRCYGVPHPCRGDAHWLAGQARRLMEQRIAAPDRQRLTGLYRHHLGVRGYITPMGRLQQTALLRDFGSRFDGLFECVSCNRPSAESRDSWLARLLSDYSYDQSPLHHLLVMRFLDLDPLSALEAAANAQPFSRPSHQARPSMRRSRRITPDLAARKREEWTALARQQPGTPLRQRNDTLYCWLWRNDRAWLQENFGRRRAHEG